MPDARSRRTGFLKRSSRLKFPRQYNMLMWPFEIAEEPEAVARDGWLADSRPEFLVAGKDWILIFSIGNFGLDFGNPHCKTISTRSGFPLARARRSNGAMDYRGVLQRSRPSVAAAEAASSTSARSNA